MINVSIRQLRYFDALARHTHFGRAAEACAISQPALSMQIKALEDALGAVLIERGARQVRLTALGEEAAQRIRDVLRAIDDLGDFARAAQGRLTGRLRLGIIPTIAPYLLPELVRNFADSHPALVVDVREALTLTLIDELADGRLDAAVLALPVEEPSLTELPLFTERFLLVRHRTDADQPVPTANKLREMRLLLLEEGHCFRDQALSFCKLQASEPRETLDASSLSTLVQMVSAGMGVTLIPEMAVGVETRAAAVSIARFPEPQPARSIGLVWRRSSPLAGQLTRLGEDVCRAFEAVCGTCVPAGERRAHRAPRAARTG